MSEDLKEALRRELGVSKPEPVIVIEAQSSAAVDPMAAETGSAMVDPIPSGPADRPKTLSQIRDESILEMESETRFVRDGDYNPATDPVTDSQRVFSIDFMEHADVLRANGVKSWTECLLKSESHPRVFPYFAAWPGRLCTFAKDGLKRARLVFTPEGERLLDTVNPYGHEAAEKAFNVSVLTNTSFKEILDANPRLVELVAATRPPVIASRIPFEKLVAGMPGLSESARKYSNFEYWPYHIVPVAAELVSFSTRGLKTPTAIALGSHVFENKRAKNMTISFNCHAHQSVVTAGGTAGFGPVLPANSSSHEMKIPGKALERSCMEETKSVLTAKFETVFGNAWFSRLAFENFANLVGFSWTDTVRPRSAGILEIKGPNIDGTDVDRLTWWILAFAPYFQAALENWYDGKTEPRPTQVEKDAIGQKIMCPANYDMTEFKLYVTQQSLFNLLEHFEKKLTLSEHAMNLQGGLRLLHQTQSSFVQQRAIADDIQAGVLRNELLTDVSTKLDFEYLVLDIGEDEKRAPQRPSAEQLMGVSGRACMCMHGDRLKQPKEGLAEKAAAVAVAAKAEAQAEAAGAGIVAGGGKLHHQAY